MFINYERPARVSVMRSALHTRIIHEVLVGPAFGGKVLVDGLKHFSFLRLLLNFVRKSGALSLGVRVAQICVYMGGLG